MIYVSGLKFCHSHYCRPSHITRTHITPTPNIQQTFHLSMGSIAQDDCQCNQTPAVFAQRPQNRYLAHLLEEFEKCTLQTGGLDKLQKEHQQAKKEIQGIVSYFSCWLCSSVSESWGKGGTCPFCAFHLHPFIPQAYFYSNYLLDKYS